MAFSEESIKAYQRYEIDNLVTEMRLLDVEDEVIYEDFVSFAGDNLTEYEQTYLAQKLGMV